MLKEGLRLMKFLALW